MQVEDFCFLIIHGYRYLIILLFAHSEWVISAIFAHSEWVISAIFAHSEWVILEKTSPRVCHVEEFTYLSVTKKRVRHRLMTHPHLYINLSLFLKWFMYIYYVLFYSYLLKLTEWLMLVISGIEFTTCFKNMPMQRTIPENITAAKAIVKIVIIIINLF